LRATARAPPIIWLIGCFFALEKHGDSYSLRRKIGDHAERDNLTIDEVEKVLERWKLEGPHGG
jgi:hypothetical protein